MGYSPDEISGFSESGMYCRICEYDLQGSENSCPECGTAFDAANADTFLVGRPGLQRQSGRAAVVASLMPFVAHGLVLLSYFLTGTNLGRRPQFGDQPIDNVWLDVLIGVSAILDFFAIPIAFVITIFAIITNMGDATVRRRFRCVTLLIVVLLWSGSIALRRLDPCGAINWIFD